MAPSEGGQRGVPPGASQEEESYGKETWRVNKICQETVMKTERGAVRSLPLEITASRTEAFSNNHDGKLDAGALRLQSGVMEERSQRMLSWRTASVWPTIFSALHTISRPLSSGERLDRVRVRLVSVFETLLWRQAKAKGHEFQKPSQLAKGTKVLMCQHTS